MGLHPSLKRAEKLGGVRSVMKRIERIKWLLGKERWKEGDKVFGLPKIKVIKIKAAKKEKPQEEGAAKEGEQPAAAAEAAAPKPEAK
jgi:small basic protein (TIGR04137 family)